MKSSCGCIPGSYDCDKCTMELRKRIWRNMSEEKRAYDRHFAPDQARALDQAILAPEGCSCHINPPCSYCVDKEEE